jgi:hypothetical protein
VARGIAGALLLARGRAAGIGAFHPTMEDARASFLAALFCLPIFLLLRAGFPAPGSAVMDPVRGLAADLIAYVCSWAGFALASLPLTEALGRRAMWPRLIAAWNWVNFVQYLVLGVLALPAMLGAPGSVADALGLVGLGYAIWMQWFAARVALQISGLRAAAFVAIDLGLSVFLSGLTARIALG